MITIPGSTMLIKSSTILMKSFTHSTMQDATGNLAKWPKYIQNKDYFHPAVATGLATCIVI